MDPDPEALLAVFRDICAIELDDGVVFDVDGLAVDRVREEFDYGGLRITTNASVGGARVRVVDIGFGDAIEPGIAELELPVLLDAPAPRLRGYPRETVIAEKLQAIVALGRANSRMKDFYDIWALSRAYKFKDDRLSRAIAATSARRHTSLPADVPIGLTHVFADDPVKQRQWSSFTQNLDGDPPSPGEVVDAIAAFLMPHALAAAHGGTDS